MFDNKNKDCATILVLQSFQRFSINYFEMLFIESFRYFKIPISNIKNSMGHEFEGLMNVKRRMRNWRQAKFIELKIKTTKNRNISQVFLKIHYFVLGSIFLMLSVFYVKTIEKTTKNCNIFQIFLRIRSFIWGSNFTWSSAQVETHLKFKI